MRGHFVKPENAGDRRQRAGRAQSRHAYTAPRAGGRLPPRAAEGAYATIHTGRPAKPACGRRSTPEKVLQAFNTWAFKREQPDNPPLMLQVIAEAVELGAAGAVRPVLGQGAALPARRAGHDVPRLSRLARTRACAGL